MTTRQCTFVMAGLFWTAMAAAEPVEPRSTLSDQITNAVSAAFTYRTPEQREVDRKTDADASIDKPKNDIIRLTRVVVKGQRPPVFREQDIYTPKALAELAIKRYFLPSAARSTLGGSRSSAAKWMVTPWRSGRRTNANASCGSSAKRSS